MRLLWVLLCVLWAWVCRGLPQTQWVKQQQQGQPKDCELYGNESAASPVMQFQRRIFVGIMPQELPFIAKLNLQSNTTGKTCQLFFMGGSVTSVCNGVVVKDLTEWPDNILSEGDTTELWMEVALGSGGASTLSWELRVVRRHGNYRAHMLVSDTGLQPPVNLWWDSSKKIMYYFNCITGCLFEKSVEMPPGDHTFFLSHDENFVQMTLDCGETTFADSSKELLLINVTAAELGPPGGLKEVKVVWNEQLGDIGVLVDGAPVGDLINYVPLKKERQVKVKVAEDGGGLVASCDPRFQKVAGRDDEEVPATTTTEPSTTSLSTTYAIYSPLVDNANPQPSQQPSSGWLPAVFTFVLLNFIVTVAAISMAIFLYCRSSTETCHFSKDASDAPAIFSKRPSTRSSTRSDHRGSQRRNRTQSDAAKVTPANPTGETMASQETVNTPLTTPDSLAHPRAQKNLSTDEFVSLSLI